MKEIVEAAHYGSLIPFFPNTRFRVEHVFRTTVYLRNLLDDSLYLISSHPWRSPFTVNVSFEGFSGLFSPGEVLSLKDGAIEGESAVVDLSRGRVYIQNIPAMIGRGIGFEDAAELLKYFGVLSSAWSGVLRSAVLERICRNRSRILSDDSLRELVGAGAGFTPSGDDFLVGLFSFLTLAKKMNILNGWIYEVREDLLKRTVWASYQYMLYALRGHFDELVLKNALALLGGDLREAEDLFLLLARRGHESGLYIWLGLITGYSLIKYNSTALLDYVCR